MYTQCPQCDTVFQISAADLGLAEGEVRCGQCETTFNALVSLSETPPAGAPRAALPGSGNGDEVPEELIEAAVAGAETEEAPVWSSKRIGSPAALLVVASDPHDAPGPYSGPGEDVLDESPGTDADDPAADPGSPGDLPRPPLDADEAQTDLFSGGQSDPDFAHEGTVAANERQPIERTDYADPSGTPGSHARVESWSADRQNIDAGGDEGSAETIVDGADETENTEDAEQAEDDDIAEDSEPPKDADIAEDAEPPGDADIAEDAERPGDADIAEDAERPGDADIAEDAEPAEDAVAAADAGPADDADRYETDPAPEREDYAANPDEARADALDLQDYLAPARQPWITFLWAACAALALAALLAQAVHHWHGVVLQDARVGGLVQAVYDRLGVPLTPDWDVSALRLLTQPEIFPDRGAADYPPALRVTAAVVNDSARPQPRPLIRVTLLDRWGEAVASRGFNAAEYGDAESDGTPLLAPGERLRVDLRILDPGIESISYTLDICLPYPREGLRCNDDATE